MLGRKIVGDNFVLPFSDSLDALPPVLILKERKGGMGEARGERAHVNTLRCLGSSRVWQKRIFVQGEKGKGTREGCVLHACGALT